jgi:hypothetical protein
VEERNYAGVSDVTATRKLKDRSRSTKFGTGKDVDVIRSMKNMMTKNVQNKIQTQPLLRKMFSETEGSRHSSMISIRNLIKFIW